MDLEELQRRLFREKPEFEGRPQAPQSFEPGRERPAGSESPYSWQLQAPQKPRRPLFTDRQKKILKFSLIGLAVVLIGLAAFFIWRSFYSFDSTKVYLKIFAPERLASGEEVSYQVRYRNDTKTVLQNVKLTFIYPADSIPSSSQNLTQIGNLPAIIKDLGDLAPGQESQMEFRANVIGLKNETKQAIAKLSYRPANIASSFENSADFVSTIFSVPLILDFDLPERVVSGQQVNLALKYLNTSEITFSNLVLSIDYPPGFSFVSALPEANQDQRTWPLTEIGAKEEGKIIISGVLSGAQDEIKSFKTRIGFAQGDSLKLISEGLTSTLVSASPLMVQLEVNDRRDYLASAGEELRYKIKYQNTVDVPLSAVYINLKFDTKVLDFPSFKISNGFFNNLDNSITWNESSLPDLKMVQPRQEKTIEFSVKVKEKLPIASFNDKNFLINTAVKIDSANVPISLRGTQLAGSDFLSLKLNSKLIISAKGYYYDSRLPNSGPLPPLVGQQTSYTLYWRVINLANDVDNVLVESYLPSYIRWLGKFEPADANVKYEQNTGKITWSLGRLPANTGILTPVKELVFQIGLVPSSIQVGNSVELIKETIISGQDLFTQALLQGKANSILSDLPDDPGVDYFKGKVVQ